MIDDLHIIKAHSAFGCGCACVGEGGGWLVGRHWAYSPGRVGTGEGKGGGPSHPGPCSLPGRGGARCGNSCPTGTGAGGDPGRSLLHTGTKHNNTYNTHVN